MDIGGPSGDDRRGTLPVDFGDITDQLLRQRRIVVFRPSTSESVPGSTTIELEILMADAHGTRSRVDDQSSLTVEVRSGNGAVITPQPQSFVNGQILCTIRRDNPGDLVVGFTGLNVVGELESGVTIDSASTKTLTA